MGRFFQTAPTQFVENYIYQPPWELMQQAASQKQKIYDAAIASTKLFDNIPIDHLQGEDDVYNVKEKQRYYAESAANIAKAIQNDPARAQQYLNNIDSLQKELQKDMTSGDLSKIIGSAQAYKKWQEDNKKLKEEDPSRYTAAERTYLNDYIRAGGNSISQKFKGDLVTKDVDWEKINSAAEKIKANEWSQQSAGAGGGYIYKNKKTGEVVTEDRIKGVIYGQLLSDPSNIAALKQSELYGLGKYFNPDTGAIDFNASGFTGTNMYAGAMAYSKQTSEQDMSSDGTYIARQRLAFDDKWKNREFEQKEKEIKQKDMWETTKLAYDPDVAPELRQAAQARLSAYYGLNDNINIKNKDYGSIGDVLQNLNDPTNKALALNYFKQKAQDANRTKSQGDYFMYKNLESAIRSGKIKDLNSFTTEANKLGEQGLKLGYNMKQESEENPVWGNIKNIFGAVLRGIKEFTPFLSDGLPLDRVSAFAKANKYYNNNSYKTQNNFTGFIINDSKKSFGEGGNYNNRNANLSVEYIAPEKSINILNNFNNPNYRNNFTFYKEGSNKPLSSDEANEIENFSKYGVGAASPYGDNTNVLIDKEGNKYIAVINNSSLESNSLQQLVNYNNYKFLPANSPIRNNISNSVANFFQTQALNVASKNPNETTIFLENPFGKESIKFNKKTGTASIIDNYGNTQELSDITQLATTILNLNK